MSFLKGIRVFGLCLFLIICVDGQQKSSGDICQQVPCRPAKKVRLKLDPVNPKKYVDFEFPKSPYVSWGDINVLAGEEVSVEFDEGPYGLINARYVDKVANPAKTITFKLTQSDTGTVLTFSNPFAKKITYDCVVQHYKSQDLKDAEVEPVDGKQTAAATFAYPAPQIVVSNFRFN